MTTTFYERALLNDAADVHTHDRALRGVVQANIVRLEGLDIYVDFSPIGERINVNIVESFYKQYTATNIPNATTQQVQETERKFGELADEWEHDVAGSSLIQDMVDHPKYREIIGLGRDALPFILERLSAQGGFWFGALHEISGEFAPSEDDLGNREKMTAAWLRWGHENDLSG